MREEKNSYEILDNLPDDFEKYKFARQKLDAEILFRRERQWRVFTWASTLLVGIIGGVVALASKEPYLKVHHRILLFFATAFLGGLAYWWLLHDAAVAKAHSDIVYKLDGKHNLRFTDTPHKSFRNANLVFIFLLTLCAIIAILIF